MELRYIDICGGIGGSAYAFEQEGYKIELLNDKDVKCYNILKKNFKNSKVLNIDMSELNLDEYKDIDVLYAGLPVLKEETEILYKRYQELIKEIEPRCFVLANVTRLLKSKMVKEMLEDLEQNYKITQSTMNAKDYGLYNDIFRLFIVGIRKDIKKEYINNHTKKRLTSEELLELFPYTKYHKVDYLSLNHVPYKLDNVELSEQFKYVGQMDPICLVKIVANNIKNVLIHQ